MNPALEALPARPLTAEDVATLNDAPALGIIPYSWYGDQVIALLLLYDERRAGEGQDDRAAEHDADAGADDDQSAEAGTGENEPPATEDQWADEGTDASADEAAEQQRPEADEQETADADEQQPGDAAQHEADDAETEPDERERDDRTAASSSTTSGFGSDDSPGVGTVEVIDSGDLTPKSDDDSLAPDLGGESDPEPVDLTEEDGDGASTASDGPPASHDGNGEETEQVETEQETPQEDAPEQEPSGPDLSGQESSEATDSEQDEADALHVYAVGFDGGVDSWVAIAEIDPDAELTDAEPLFREWATRTYHDQIVDRLAIGPSEYDIDE